jgi:hypothetical protein
MPKVEDIIAKIKEKLSPDVPVEVYNSGKGMHSARVARYK